jgi:hypothetical protein
MAIENVQCGKVVCDQLPRFPTPPTYHAPKRCYVNRSIVMVRLCASAPAPMFGHPSSFLTAFLRCQLHSRAPITNHGPTRHLPLLRPRLQRSRFSRPTDALAEVWAPSPTATAGQQNESAQPRRQWVRLAHQAVVEQAVLPPSRLLATVAVAVAPAGGNTKRDFRQPMIRQRCLRRSRPLSLD